MVGTRKTPGGKTTFTLDGSLGLQVVGDEEDITDITDQSSAIYLAGSVVSTKPSGLSNCGGKVRSRSRFEEI
jgi:hypothetical protein